jgi:tetratricopeptide (TPR) repeat protein
MHRAMRWLVVGAVCCAISNLAGCALAPYHRAASISLVRTDPYKKLRAESYFVKARDYEMLGFNEKALLCYETAYALDPQSQTLRDLLVEKYAASSHFSHALLLAKNGKKDEELSDGERRACAGIYLHQGKIGAVTDMMEKIKDKRSEEYHTLALVYESKGNLAKAAHNYGEFLKKRPESLQMWLKTAGIYTELKRYGAAESLFVEIEHRFGQTPELLNSIGLTKLAKGDTTLAINSFQMASLIDTAYEEGAENLARIFLQQGNWERAISNYEKLHVAMSGSEFQRKALAVLYYFTKNYEKAWSLLSQLLSDKQSDPDIHYYGGLALEGLDSLDLARAEFEKAVALNKYFADAWQQLCYVAIRLKDFSRALSIAEDFKNALPRLAFAWRMGAYVYNAQKQYDRAIPLLKKALELDSNDVSSWFELGTSLERTNEKEKAALAFRKVLTLRPGDPPAANYLAYMWAEQGINLDSARFLLTMALKQDSLNGAYLDSYAWIFFKMGLIDTAYIYIVKALGRIGDDPVVYTHSGDILAKKGDLANALKAYKQGLGLAIPDKATPEEIDDLKKKISDLENVLKNKSDKILPNTKTAP